MKNQNIFLSQEGGTENQTGNGDNTDITGKITYTSIIESIPESKSEKPISNWEQKYKVEWRWRFLKDGKRHVVEISYVNKKNIKDRLYFNKYGQWVKQDIGSEYDKFVVKEYYVYTFE
jgi:hypothetical protein